MARSGTGAPADIFFEDLTPGREFDLGTVTIDRSEMIDYARRYDPQWYHVDPAGAADSPYGDVIASGFFTISLFMRAYVDAVLSRAASSASPGLEELRWFAAVYAGDTLAVRLAVVDAVPSASRPGFGTVTLEGTMTRVPVADRSEKLVLRTRFRGWFAQRPAA